MRRQKANFKGLNGLHSRGAVTQRAQLGGSNKDLTTHSTVAPPKSSVFQYGSDSVHTHTHTHTYI